MENTSGYTFQYLEIKYCLDLSFIEISGANIVSFIYCGQIIDLSFNNVPLLVEVSVYKWGTFAEFIRLAFSQLSCRLSHLETLKLDIRGAVSILIPCYLVEIKYCRVPYSVVVGFQVYNQNHAFPVLSNLKHLELLVDANYCLSLGRLASFMKAAPDLRSLVLGVFGVQNLQQGHGSTRESFQTTPSLPQGGRNNPITASKFPNNPITASRWYWGHKCCVKHVRYLVKNAVALEKIVINPVRFWGWPWGFDSDALLENEKENARDHAIQHLKKKVPTSIEFVCL
ncbi:uncharacterized protein [Pyrus communis]|uniref:uncharacterized protein n=1 Tax=Pyrus communis TaxID=23211 RepID=UPI0035C16A57